MEKSLTGQVDDEVKNVPFWARASTSSGDCGGRTEQMLRVPVPRSTLPLIVAVAELDREAAREALVGSVPG